MRRYLLILFAGVLVTSCKQDATTEFVKEIRCYSDYSSVAWSDLSERYYHPNMGDWDPEMNKQIIKDFPIEISTEIWHLLQNARTDFHQKSLPLRAKAQGFLPPPLMERMLDFAMHMNSFFLTILEN